VYYKLAKRASRAPGCVLSPVLLESGALQGVERMSRKWRVRLLLAVAAGLLLAWLPTLLTQGVGPSADLSGKLGLSGGVSIATFAILFAAGVLTSLTPCVYPLIPITVGVFGARQAEHRARSAALSATYVGGIALTFSALGVFAALSGK